MERNYRAIAETQREGFSSFQRKVNRVSNHATTWRETLEVAAIAEQFIAQYLADRNAEREPAPMYGESFEQYLDRLYPTTVESEAR